jgi:hypothetical protein
LEHRRFFFRLPRLLSKRRSEYAQIESAVRGLSQ